MGSAVCYCSYLEALLSQVLSAEKLWYNTVYVFWSSTICFFVFKYICMPLPFVLYILLMSVCFFIDIWDLMQCLAALSGTVDMWCNCSAWFLWYVFWLYLDHAFDCIEEFLSLDLEADAFTVLRRYSFCTLLLVCGLMLFLKVKMIYMMGGLQVKGHVIWLSYAQAGCELVGCVYCM